MEATANFTKHIIPSISNLQISAMQIFEMSAMYLFIYTRISDIYGCSLHAVDLATN